MITDLYTQDILKTVHRSKSGVIQEIVYDVISSDGQCYSLKIDKIDRDRIVIRKDMESKWQKLSHGAVGVVMELELEMELLTGSLVAKLSPEFLQKLKAQADRFPIGKQMTEDNLKRLRSAIHVKAESVTSANCESILKSSNASNSLLYHVIRRIGSSIYWCCGFADKAYEIRTIVTSKGDFNLKANPESAILASSIMFRENQNLISWLTELGLVD